GCVVSFLLSFTRPRPARSPLFPYTTLFRSVPTRGAEAVRARRLLLGRMGGPGPLREPAARRSRAAPIHWRDHPAYRAAGRRGHEDRKSTRLNSSHVSISYAVFCLKKKTTTQ